MVLDVETNLPILTSRLASRGEMACRWIGSQLKELGQIPKWFITDGMTAYNYLKEELGENVKHLQCRFHRQQANSRWVQKHFKGDEELIKKRKKELKEGTASRGQAYCQTAV